MSFAARRRRRAETLEEPASGPDPVKTLNPVHTPPEAAPDAIPPHVWDLLQTAGQEAAARLVELLRSVRFATLPPSAQARLIELAMTRAYGLPVRRSVEVKLSSGDADAVAASLMALGDALPERRGMVDISPQSQDEQSQD